MKKIFFSIVALAALAACSKSEVQYENPQEIGFAVVANTITKAPVLTGFPEELSLYVNAFTTTYEPEVGETPAPDYFGNVVFARNSTSGKWAGNPAQYWPNETMLQFSGYSISGNIGEGVDKVKGSYDPDNDQLTITGYNPGDDTDEGANDLMWFPATIAYDKTSGASGVEADMYHTCSWITFLVQGNELTSDSNGQYTVTSLKINDVNMIGKVICSGGTATDENDNPVTISNRNLKYFVKWSDLYSQTDYVVTIPTAGIPLVGTYVAENQYEAKNIETGLKNTTDGNIVVIPQAPTTIDLEWTYMSPAGKIVTDTATGKSLTLGTGINWEPGKHYVYTITIGANEILVSPDSAEWVNGDMNGNGGVTVE